MDTARAVSRLSRLIELLFSQALSLQAQLVAAKREPRLVQVSKKRLKRRSVIFAAPFLRCFAI